MIESCVQYINLTTLVPKLNEQRLLTLEEERDITNPILRVREGITRLLECVGKKKDGWRKFLKALEAESSHGGHTSLLADLKRLPSVEGMQQCVRMCS